MNTNAGPSPAPFWRRPQPYAVSEPNSEPDHSEAADSGGNPPDSGTAEPAANPAASDTAEPTHCDPDSSAPEAGVKPRRSETSAPGAPPNPDRHSRKCAICHHDDREDIEDAFLHWTSPGSIVTRFNLPSRSALYRHAEATGLSAQRRRRVRVALDQIIEQVGNVQVTGSTVLRAIMMSAQMNEEGVYREPPKRTEITYINAPTQPPPSQGKGTKSNRDKQILESLATPTK
jgi:hypothetical protein